MSEEKSKLNEFETELQLWLALRNAMEWTPPSNSHASEKIRSIPLSEAVATWGLVVDECGKKVKTDGLHPHWYRFSIEHVSSKINEDFSFNDKDLVKRCQSNLKNFLDWQRSELGKACGRLGDKIIDKWASQQYGLGVQTLIRKMRKGSLAATKTLFQAIGKSDGNPASMNQPLVEWTKDYVIVDGKPIARVPEVPVEEN